MKKRMVSYLLIFSIMGIWAASITNLSSAAGSLKIQMYNSNTAGGANSINPFIRLFNQSSAAINLSTVTVRYYYTVDGDKAQSYWCDYASISSPYTAITSSVTGKFVKMATPATGADYYLEISFTSGAGSLSAGASVDIQARFVKTDWTNYTQTGDYSFNSSATSFVDSNNVTAYVSGALQWGIEPGGGTPPATSTPTPTVRMQTPTPTLRLTPTPSTTTTLTPTPTGRRATVTPTPRRRSTPTFRPSSTQARRVTPTSRQTPSPTATPLPTATPTGRRVTVTPTSTVRRVTVTPTPTPYWSWPPVTNFMTASGTGFQNGFKFMGANLDPWRFNTAEGEVYSQAEIGLWVANAVQYTHARVIRMHINGGAFEPTVGTYGEPAFKQLDYLLAEAAKNNVYVLISLRDYCWGPWPPDGCYDSYWYMHGGTPASPKKDNIQIEPDTIVAFKNFISYVVNRVNTVTGVTYKNDPHILGWEIINEPNMISGIKNWFIDISSYLKSVDPNHMVGVATGDLSSATWWGPSSSSWNDLSIPQFDFISIHYYGDYYDPSNTDWVSRWNQVLQTVKTLGKPVIVDEFGLPSNFELSKIINFHQTIITSSLNAGLPGVMPYSWGPPGPNYWGDSGSFCYYTDDPALCDLFKSLAP